MITKEYIIPALGGRLGNNLFMIANVYARGIEFNKQVVVYKPHVQYHGNDFSKTIFRKLQFVDFFDDNGAKNPPKPEKGKHTIYVGYFQSENYFKQYSEIIKDLFAPTEQFVQELKKTMPFLFDTSIVTTCINVRRGDYLLYPNYHPTVSREYIQAAADKIKNTDRYLIASDDIAWCKENIKLDKPCVYLDGSLPPENQLWTLSFCKNFIISNSSFSWWAAYLSRAEGKVVIAPETWFGPQHTVSWADIYCKGWIILPTYFDNALIKPK